MNRAKHDIGLIPRLLAKHNLFLRLYAAVTRISPRGYANLLRSTGAFEFIGVDTQITPGCEIPDPGFVKVGARCLLSKCTILGHDGSIDVLSRAYRVPLDRVGAVVIGDDVFIGYGAILLPGISVGSGSIVGAGAIVTRDVPAGVVVAGSPARVVKTTDEYVKELAATTAQLPWFSHIASRIGGGDPVDISPGELNRIRRDHFFG